MVVLYIFLNVNMIYHQQKYFTSDVNYLVISNSQQGTTLNDTDGGEHEKRKSSIISENFH